MAEQLTIRNLCREHSLTQRALAERFGIPLRTVEDWSTGKHKCPDYVVRMIRTILEHEEKAHKDEYIINCKQNSLTSEEVTALLRKSVDETTLPQRSKRANVVPLMDESGEVVALVQEDLVSDVLKVAKG